MNFESMDLNLSQETFFHSKKQLVEREEKGKRGVELRTGTCMCHVLPTLFQWQVAGLAQAQPSVLVLTPIIVLRVECSIHEFERPARTW